MKRYHVLVEGSELDLPDQHGGSNTLEKSRVGGFYVWRIVCSSAPELAGQAAIAAVADEWSRGEYAAFGATPKLVVAEVRQLSWFYALRARDTGYVFYPAA